MYPICRVAIQKIPTGIAVHTFKYVAHRIIDDSRNTIVDVKYGRWSNDNTITFFSDFKLLRFCKYNAVLSCM